ncbi:hypothetical protein [Anaerosphaera aminiphila]|nr:hypothetical protein [Anaerosphaera aminiphila]
MSRVLVLLENDYFEEPNSMRIGYRGDTDELIGELEKLSKYMAKLKKN